MNYCDDEGFLVGAQKALENPMKAYSKMESEIRGCSQLRCSECGQKVLHFEGKTPKRIYTPQEMKVLYHETGLQDAVMDYEADPLRRLYGCACSWCAISKYPESCLEMRLDSGPFWYCSGHTHS